MLRAFRVVVTFELVVDVAFVVVFGVEVEVEVEVEVDNRAAGRASDSLRNAHDEPRPRIAEDDPVAPARDAAWPGDARNDQSRFGATGDLEDGPSSSGPDGSTMTKAPPPSDATRAWPYDEVALRRSDSKTRVGSRSPRSMTKRLELLFGPPYSTQYRLAPAMLIAVTGWSRSESAVASEPGWPDVMIARVERSRRPSQNDTPCAAARAGPCEEGVTAPRVLSVPSESRTARTADSSTE
jgi:hypothetical protein